MSAGDGLAAKKTVNPPIETDPASSAAPNPILDICKALAAYDPGADVGLVKRCYEFAAERHAGQRRRSGEPYVVHPLGVARTITELRLDVASVCAGLLHDCVEDTSATAEDIGRLFGTEIQFLVDGVTKLGQIPWTTREERQAENFRKMLLAMARDIRVILIKLADRVDNMRTLQHMPRDKQERISRETREIYAPLANRLGIQWMKVELEDLAFRYLEPEDFATLTARMADTADSRAGYIQEVCDKLRAALTDAGISAQISGRAKHLWSIYQKMKKAGRDLEQIYDVIAFRAITESVRDCYAVLGVVHSSWTPVPGRFKDFIALPKPNLYQSLHTTVIGPRADRMEVQIRTQEMHRIAEQGIAAHWKYKEGEGEDGQAQRGLSAEDGKAFAWLRQLMEWQRDLKDPTEFIETVKIDLFQDEVFVFTPKGDVKALPKGSTPIDLAYAIHSQLGEHCSGARVNGLIVPLRYALRNGDTVDILASANQKPSKDWLKFVVTSRAKTKIRHFIRMEQRERSAHLGRDLLGRELRKRDAALSSAEREGLLESAATRLRVGSAEDLLVAVGYGRVSPEHAADAVLFDRNREEGSGPTSTAAEQPATTVRRPTAKRSVAGIRVQGEADILVKFAKCCSPVPGDSIVGFVSRGHGVVIHTRECPKALDLDPIRRVEVGWDDETRTLRPVAVQVTCEDRPGLLASISKSFTENGVNISQAKCRTTEDGRAVNTFQVTVGHLEQLKTVLRSLHAIDGVVSATRL
jgi:GTP pyrophosphokinase